MINIYTVCLWILFIANFAISANNNELIIVHTIWRHGERTPIYTYRNDPHPESAWFQGFGQLTVRGMEQQVELGKLLHNEYVTNLEFLSRDYHSNEIYVRSTDRNRTLMSAYSNLIGFYYKQSQKEAGVDYPIDPLWPAGYIPIAVHTTDRNKDHICDPLTPCPRRDWLWSQTERTPTFKKFLKQNERLLKNLTEICGQKITMDNLWMVCDVTQIENDHNMKTVIDTQLYNNAQNINGLVDNMQDGLDTPPYDGIDFLAETAKIRGGSLIWDILNRIDLKIACLNESRQEKRNVHCAWINNLKYYAYSAHDNTMTALMTTLGIKENVIAFGYPNHASAIILELWKSENQYFIKIRYRKFQAKKLIDITDKFHDCRNGKPCSYELIYNHAKTFYPGNITQLCTDVTSKSTNFWPPQSL